MGSQGYDIALGVVTFQDEISLDFVEYKLKECCTDEVERNAFMDA